MVHRPGTFLEQGINNYVPAMSYASSMIHGQPTRFSLGTPAAVSANAVVDDLDGDAVAGTVFWLTTPWVADSPFGRTLRVTPSADPGAALGIFDVYGEDWLGQPMVERFTGANGSTAILYGKKAFYRVIRTKIVTAATNAITFDIGTGWRFGLPYKGDLVWAKENGVFVPVYKRDFWMQTEMAGSVVAGGPSGGWIETPTPGFVKGIHATAGMPVGSTNDPAVTVELATVAVTGLTVTVDVSAAATAAEVTDVPTTAGYSANNRFRAGDLIEIVLSDADAVVGNVRVEVEITPTHFTPPVYTDPQTVILGDPRGTYEPLMTPDDTAELEVGIMGDVSVNAAGNGGLYGIRHLGVAP